MSPARKNYRWLIKNNSENIVMFKDLRIENNYLILEPKATCELQRYFDLEVVMKSIDFERFMKMGRIS